MNFVEVIFGVILTVFSARVSGDVLESDRARLHAISQDIWTASDTASELPFQGEAAREASAMALVAVAYHESGFWSKVQDCSICYKGSAWCGQGRSITIYQLEGSFAWGGYTREELCTSNAKASERALAVLARWQAVARPLTMFDGYARGRLGDTPSRAARELTSIFESFSQKAGIRITSDGRRMQAKWRTAAK